MFIETIPPDEATATVADLYASATHGWGFLPNWARVLALHPEAWAGWEQLNGAIKKGMERRRYELATIAAAQRLRSTYCAMAHSWMLRDHLHLHETGELHDIVMDRAAAAALDDTDRAVMVFAEKVAGDAAAITAADVDVLRRHGLSDTDIVDVALAAAARCFFAKVLDAVGAQADGELGELLGPDLEHALTVGRPVEPA